MVLVITSIWTTILTSINLILVLCGIAGFILLLIVLFKLNKALNIWLSNNKKI